MTIGATIKKLRRERDMTQEQLAAFMNITAPAVSQWECDRSAPDISQLPILANIFEVSADVLLGIDIGAKQKKIDKIRDEAKEYSYNGKTQEALDILHAGLREFPDSYEIMEDLTWCLWRPLPNDTPEAMEKREAERISLFEKIYNGCTDVKMKNHATAALCAYYSKHGRKDEAKNMAETIPMLDYSYFDVKMSMCEGTEKFCLWKLDIESKFVDLCWQIRNLTLSSKNDNGADAFNADEKIVIWNKLLSFLEIYYENGDYNSNYQLAAYTNFELAKVYASMRDADNTLRFLEHMIEPAVLSDKWFDGQCGNNVVLPPEKQNTSLLTVRHDTLIVSKPTTENQCHELFAGLSNKIFDFIRSEPRFSVIENELKKHAKG